MIQPERRTDRHHPLAGLDRIRTADAQGRQTGRGDLQQGDVGLLVAAHHFRGELAPIRQADTHGVRAFHHVVVGQHIAVLGNDEAGALRHPARLLAGHARHRAHARAEEATEEFRNFLFTRGLLLAALRGGARVAANLRLHAHHRRTNLVHQAGEVRQAGDQFRRGRRCRDLRGGTGHRCGGDDDGCRRPWGRGCRHVVGRRDIFAFTRRLHRKLGDPATELDRFSVENLDELPKFFLVRWHNLKVAQARRKDLGEHRKPFVASLGE